MQTEQRTFTHQDAWTPSDAPTLGASIHLVLAFGLRTLLAEGTAISDGQAKESD